MNPDIALSVELTKQRQSQADTLRQVVKVLVEKNNLQGLEEATSSIGKTPLTNFETIIQDLENEWKAYQLPFDTRDNYFSMLQIYLRNQQTEKRARDQLRRQQQFYQSQRPNIFHIHPHPSLPTGNVFLGPNDQPDPTVSLDLDPIHIDYSKWIIEEGDVTRALSPTTLLPLPRPLQFRGNISYEKHFSEHCEIFLPKLKLLNLHQTVHNLLIRGQYLGCTKVQMKKVFEQLITKHYPSHCHVIDNTPSPDSAFKVLLHLVTPGDYLNAISIALEAVERQIDTPIKAVLDEYSCLTTMKFKYSCPHLSYHAISNKAYNMTRYVLKFFISPKMKSSLDNFLHIRRQNGEDTNSMKDMVNFIDLCESQDSSYRITQTMKVPPTQAPDINVFAANFRKYQSPSRSRGTSRSSSRSSYQSSRYSSRNSSGSRRNSSNGSSPSSTRRDSKDSRYPPQNRSSSQRYNYRDRNGYYKNGSSSKGYNKQKYTKDKGSNNYKQSSPRSRDKQSKNSDKYRKSKDNSYKRDKSRDFRKDRTTKDYKSSRDRYDKSSKSYSRGSRNQNSSDRSRTRDGKSQNSSRDSSRNSSRDQSQNRSATKRSQSAEKSIDMLKNLLENLDSSKNG